MDIAGFWGWTDNFWDTFAGKDEIKWGLKCHYLE
jgi:hypothetical protein